MLFGERCLAVRQFLEQLVVDDRLEAASAPFPCFVFRVDVWQGNVAQGGLLVVFRLWKIDRTIGLG